MRRATEPYKNDDPESPLGHSALPSSQFVDKIMSKTTAKVAPTRKLKQAERLWDEDDSVVPKGDSAPVSTATVVKVKSKCANVSKRAKILIGMGLLFLLAGLIVLILFLLGVFKIKSNDAIDPCNYPFNFPSTASSYKYIFETSSSTTTLRATLPKSKSSELVFLKRVREGLSITLARSYDNYPWESVLLEEPIKINCSYTACETDIFSTCMVEIDAAADQEGASFTYQLENLNAQESLDELNWGRDNDAARLLIQATFGPTKKSLAAVPAKAGTSFIDANTWINAEFAKPMTSLRQRWRERSSPRITGAFTPGQQSNLFGQSNLVEAITTPCDVGSRWHRYSFTYKDLHRKVVVNAIEKVGVFTLRVDGILRTEVNEFAGLKWSNSVAQSNATQIREYFICSVSEMVDESVRVRIIHDPNTDVSCKGYNFHNWNRNEWTAKNPPLNFSQPDPDVTYEYTDPDDVRLAPVVSTMGDAVIIDYMSPSRSSMCDPSKKIGTYHSLLLVNNIYYRYDPRLKRLKNTIESPFVPELSKNKKSYVNTASCPSVGANFLNHAHCKKSTSCGPETFTSALFQLNHSTLKRWYEKSGKFLYAVKGLRLEDIYEVSPCSAAKSRWMRLNSTSACNPTTSVDNMTYATIQKQISDSFDISNMYVRDVKVGTSNCSANQDAVGATTVGMTVLDLDGKTCWKHVHPNMYDVIDFTQFTVSHGGTRAFYFAGKPNPIKRWAEGGHTIILFPHEMGRFKDALRFNLKTILGRYGDMIDFATLPSHLQTHFMAELFGSTPVTVKNKEAKNDLMCGSPYEVENIPTYGHHYVSGASDGTVISQPYWETDRRYNYGGDKYQVFNTVAFEADDQLRQRMGFALTQIFSVGELGFGGFGYADVPPWAYFHDIMLRHAFGNYRDLIKEVVYSPFMSQYLTFLGSRSLFSSKTYPDENFARELMQLFTIGLVELKDNGVEEVSEDGTQVVATYSTEDITNFARAWTGFDNRYTRKRITRSVNMDPLDIDPTYRDRFPKTKLKRSGYIGDAYPLCSDLPARHFLSKGAKFVYTGSRSASGVETKSYRNELNDFEPSFSGSSALYKKLCQRSNGKCTFPKEITLDKNIPCDPKPVVREPPKPYVLPATLELKIGKDNPCVESAGHTKAHGRYVALCTLAMTGLVKTGTSDHLEFTTPRNEKFRAAGVMHWSWSSKNWYFFPDQLKAEDLNKILKMGDVLTVARPQNKDYVSSMECDADSIDFVKMVDPMDGNNTVYYSYQKVPCVNLVFFQKGVLTKITQTNQCADPKMAVASSSCCTVGGHVPLGSTLHSCNFFNERMKYETSKARCESLGGNLCKDILWSTPTERISCSKNYPSWRSMTDNACHLKVKVNKEGQIAIYDFGSGRSAAHDNQRFQENDNTYYFNVVWSTNAYPNVDADGCKFPDGNGYVDSNDDRTAPLGCVVRTADKGEPTCECDITVETKPVFTSSSSLPKLSDIKTSLFIGAPDPTSFDDGVYSLCTHSICTNGEEKIEIYFKSGHGNNFVLDSNTIFKLPLEMGGSKHTYLYNKVSQVFVGERAVDGKGFNFRNAPTFMPLVGEMDGNWKWKPEIKDTYPAELETDAVIDYLISHKNTPTFVSKKIIQRFVTSNPSPRYLKVVADAFRSGRYDGSTKEFSGRRGDLAATLAATLLDREARSNTVMADPSFGQLREPLVKVIHLLRSMDFKPNEDTTEVELKDTQNQIGQGIFQVPSVFGYFSPTYQAPGSIKQSKLFSPEGELSTAPYLVNFLNGLTALIDDGFTTCNGGWTTHIGGKNCDYVHLIRKHQQINKRANGFLKFYPTKADATPTEVIDEMSLLLTAGRVSEYTKRILVKQYVDALKPTGTFNCKCYLDRYKEVRDQFAISPHGDLWEPTYKCSSVKSYYTHNGAKNGHDPSCSNNKEYAWKEALKIFLVSSEFHITNLNRLTGAEIRTPPRVQSLGRPFKAIVVVMMAGGADTFNLLVPHSNCPSGDLFEEYATARGGVWDPAEETGGAALSKNTFHTIIAEANTQPCGTFGVHHKLPILKTLYDAKQCAFLANTGFLIEPFDTVDEFKKKAKKIPKGIGDHRGAQTHAQTVDARSVSSPGVLGRLMKQLSTKKKSPYKTNLFSFNNMKITEGGMTSPYILSKTSTTGIPQFKQYSQYQDIIANVTSRGSHSHFANTISNSISSALEQTEELATLMEGVKLTKTFNVDREINSAFNQISKIIKLRDELKLERAGFIASVHGFDTHHSFDDQTSLHFDRINSAISTFKEEMDAQNMWDNVAILLVSDFGRTITSNGKGTDHGWGGNYAVVGGKVNGGKILGKYPTKLGNDGELNIGRGRIIPSTGWEGVWSGLSEWMGVENDEELTQVLPNLKNFPESKLFRRDELFK